MWEQYDYKIDFIFQTRTRYGSDFVYWSFKDQITEKLFLQMATAGNRIPYPLIKVTRSNTFTTHSDMFVSQSAYFISL